MHTSAVNPAVTLANATAAHARWKMKFRTAISERAPVDPASFHKDRCELGNWLSGAGRDRYGSHPEFSSLVERNDAFHVEAAKVVTALKERKFGEAAHMIAPGSAFSRTSSDVNISVSFLRRGFGV